MSAETHRVSGLMAMAIARLARHQIVKVKQTDRRHCVTADFDP
jgi:hypothetical protein